ncbi:hypothetical protein [Neptunicella sp. SCSIO 80796]|uniref:hypothetical protein n=1 Tax=Neptunicella plasticusilytica TaxID=3117012 RepID=UPI003A4D2F1A
MKWYQQATELLAKQPLPNNAPDQLQELANKATGQEKQFINHCFEALYAAATPEQVELWQDKGNQ